MTRTVYALFFLSLFAQATSAGVLKVVHNISLTLRTTFVFITFPYSAISMNSAPEAKSLPFCSLSAVKRT